jgi:hypothetical protein
MHNAHDHLVDPEDVSLPFALDENALKTKMKAGASSSRSSLTLLLQEYAVTRDNKFLQKDDLKLMSASELRDQCTPEMVLRCATLGLAV